MQNRSNVDSGQGNGQTTPGYSYPFRATVKNGTGKQKNNIEIIFEDDPPQEVIATLLANYFHYDKEREVWFRTASSDAKQLADDIIRRGLLPVEISSEVESPTQRKKKPYKAKKIVPVSNLIFPPDGIYYKPVIDAIKKGIQSIDSVHYIDKTCCDPLTVKLIKKEKNFDARFISYPLEIQVCKIKTPRISYVVHEIGHYLDFSLGERIDDWRGKLITTIKRTKWYKSFKNFDFRSTGKVLITDVNGTREKNRPLSELSPSFAYRIYAGDNDELFARAYEQYIAIKSGEFLDEIEKYTEYRLSLNYIKGVRTPIYKTNSLPMYWKWNDFRGVETVFDQMFFDIGWKVPTK